MISRKAIQNLLSNVFEDEFSPARRRPQSCHSLAQRKGWFHHLLSYGDLHPHRLSASCGGAAISVMRPRRSTRKVAAAESLFTGAACPSAARRRRVRRTHRACETGVAAQAPFPGTALPALRGPRRTLAAATEGRGDLLDVASSPFDCAVVAEKTGVRCISACFSRSPCSAYDHDPAAVARAPDTHRDPPVRRADADGCGQVDYEILGRADSAFA